MNRILNYGLSIVETRSDRNSVLASDGDFRRKAIV